MSKRDAIWAEFNREVDTILDRLMSEPRRSWPGTVVSRETSRLALVTRIATGIGARPEEKALLPMYREAMAAQEALWGAHDEHRRQHDRA